MSDSLCACVYLVAFSDWDVHHTVSAWTTEEAANDEAKRLNDLHSKSAGMYEVEGFPLDRVSE